MCINMCMCVYMYGWHETEMKVMESSHVYITNGIFSDMCQVECVTIKLIQRFPFGQENIRTYLFWA